MHLFLLSAFLGLALASMLLYFPLNRGRARYFLESPLDPLIPFVPSFIYPYLLLIPFILIGLGLVFPTPYAEPLYLALILGVLAGSLTRFFVHSGIRQPEIRGKDLANRLVHWLYRHDDRAHTFPSSHVLISLIMSHYLALAFPAWAAGIWTLGGLIAVSTVFVKQHYALDVVAGAAYAVVAVHLANLLSGTVL